VPDPAWPVDVRVLASAICARLVEPKLHLVELERQYGLRDHNIATQFRACVEMTPKQYRLALQIGLAKRLLRHPALQETSLTQIALAVGFEPSAFSERFRKRMGCTPTAYRVLFKENV